VLATLEDLDEPTLKRILVEPRNALVKQYQRLFKMEKGNSQAVGYAIRVGMTWLGGAARVWRILQPCFLAVETTDSEACEDLSAVEGSE